MSEVKVQVYIDDGRVFEYSVPSEEKAREHSYAIVMTGYRHVSKDEPSVLEHFGPHRVSKVKVSGLTSVDTAYMDTTRGT